MKNLRTILLTALAAGSITAATAQSTETDDRIYPFVGIQGGVQGTFTDYNFGKLLTPVVGLQIGQYYTPVVGSRLSFNGWRGKTGLHSTDKTYGYNYATADLDLLINLSNAIYPRTTHKFNVALIAGAGLYWAKYDDKSAVLRKSGSEGSFNFRGGLQFSYDVSHNVGLSLEVLATGLDDNFNMKRNGKIDWQGSAMVGLTYKFRKKKNKSETASSMMSQDYNGGRGGSLATTNKPDAEAEARRKAAAEAAKRAEEAAKRAEAEKAAAQAATPKETRSEIFFTIGKADLSAADEAQLGKLAQWLKQHPEAKVTVTGYADAGTGTPEINKAVSKRRADKVAGTLKNKFGIPASRIIVEAKGDTEQPFAENDKNRVVIGVAK